MWQFERPRLEIEKRREICVKIKLKLIKINCSIYTNLQMTNIHTEVLLGKVVSTWRNLLFAAHHMVCHALKYIQIVDLNKLKKIFKKTDWAEPHQLLDEFLPTPLHTKSCVKNKRNLLVQSKISIGCGRYGRASFQT